MDAFTAKLVAKSIPIRNITFWVQDIGAHDMGTTIKYDFVNAVYNVPEGNYYVIFEAIDFDKNKNTIILSEGVIEESKYAATHEKNQEYVDSYTGEIYATERRLGSCKLKLMGGATENTDGSIKLDAVNEGVIFYHYLPSELDVERDIIFYIPFYRNEAGADTITMKIWIFTQPLDGLSALTDIRGTSVGYDALTFPASNNGTFMKTTITVDDSDLVADSYLYVNFMLNEAGKNIDIYEPKIQYFGKRY